MSSIHHIQHSPLQPLEGNHDQVPHLIPFFPVYDPSPFTYPTFSLPSSQAQACHQDIHPPQEDDESSHSGGSSDDPLLFMVSLSTKVEYDEKGTSPQQQHTFHTPEDGSIKWMSSKMRLMRKMMNSNTAIVRKPPRRSVQALPEDQQQQPAGIIRVCSDCNTTKTPLWRSGPQGPKSLCNACGIRQRKARKAMAAAAAPVNSESNHPDKVPKERCMEGGRDHSTVPFKKRCKFTTAGLNDANGFEGSDMSLGQNSHLHKVFPQDEKEAAILLMALSCGLVCR